MNRTLKQYQVDAFSKGPFTGNPAAVVPMTEWISDHLMQNIATENNLSETAFFVPYQDHYHIRWFTPAAEVKLCGHATLATAYVIYHYFDPVPDRVRFHSLSGELSVEKKGAMLELNFPADTIQPIDPPEGLEQALGVEIQDMGTGVSDLIVRVESEMKLKALKPDFAKLSQYGDRGIIVTAEGGDRNNDFVSRCFYPRYGINEDPATGSAHTTLIPYWSKRLAKTELTACQLSDRKGYFRCALRGDRTLIAGEANLFMIGSIFI